jgi:hypothetical protein
MEANFPVLTSHTHTFWSHVSMTRSNHPLQEHPGLILPRGRVSSSRKILLTNEAIEPVIEAWSSEVSGKQL